MSCRICKTYECNCIITEDDIKDDEIKKLKKQLKEAHEFLCKTNGSSKDKNYLNCTDYWHDLGWEKDLTAYFKKYK
jgi:hypothetical protein